MKKEAVVAVSPDFPWHKADVLRLDRQDFTASGAVEGLDLRPAFAKAFPQLSRLHCRFFLFLQLFQDAGILQDQFFRLGSFGLYMFSLRPYGWLLGIFPGNLLFRRLPCLIRLRQQFTDFWTFGHGLFLLALHNLDLLRLHWLQTVEGLPLSRLVLLNILLYLLIQPGGNLLCLPVNLFPLHPFFPGSLRQLHLGRVGHCILPDRPVRAPGIGGLMDGKTVTRLHANPGIRYILHRHRSAKFPGAAPDKNSSQTDLLSRRQQIYPQIASTHINLLHTDAQPALTVSGFQLHKADISPLRLPFIRINIGNQSPVICHTLTSPHGTQHQPPSPPRAKCLFLPLYLFYA